MGRSKNSLLQFDRRQFLSGAATTVCTGVAAAAAADEAASQEVIHIGPVQRPRTDLEAWNVGLITAYRPELPLAENRARNRELSEDLKHVGWLYVRGRYIENYGTPGASAREVHWFFLSGRADDSGNLKGLLRKYGRKYGQDAVLHKGYYRDAELYALKDLPDLELSDGDRMSLGRFHPNRVGHYITLMARRGRSVPPANWTELTEQSESTDWLGGRWEDIGFWTRPSFFSRSESRVHFDESGNRDAT